MIQQFGPLLYISIWAMMILVARQGLIRRGLPMATVEEMERRAFSVQAMHPIKDKRARLRVAARYIKMGIVKFPRTGCEQLLTQLLGFGSEKHDDAVDALVYLILGLAGDGIEEPRVAYV
jgi:predicted phage terminase large subunit-like protein